MIGSTTAFSPRCAPVMVRKGSATSSTRPPWVKFTKNGRSASRTKRFMPRATRASVLAASGRIARSPCFAITSAALLKIDGQGSVQSMQVSAPIQGSSLPWRTSAEAGLPCVGFGQTIGRPSLRATRNQRLRIVGEP